jgi:hypothetical protein
MPEWFTQSTDLTRKQLVRLSWLQIQLHTLFIIYFQGLLQPPIFKDFLRSTFFFSHLTSLKSVCVLKISSDHVAVVMWLSVPEEAHQNLKNGCQQLGKDPKDNS